LVDIKCGSEQGLGIMQHKEIEDKKRNRLALSRRMPTTWLVRKQEFAQHVIENECHSGLARVARTGSLSEHHILWKDPLLASLAKPLWHSCSMA
jgi:hypothetical protein